jgi:iron complex transport system ATP-binding protein
MLEIQSVSVSYGDRLVLKDVSLEVRPGEIVALIGPNGAGKSTLIRAISGVIPRRGGSIHLNGREISTLTADSRARLLGVVPQAQSLPFSFNVYQTVLLGRTPHLGWLGQAGRKDHEIVRRAMEQTQTSGLTERLIGELSGGEQQRVLLARALAQSTPILLLDEPTNHLDLHHQTGFLRLVRQLALENGLAVLVALHDLNLASLYADTIALLADGQLKALGMPEQVLTEAILAPIYGGGLRVIAHPETGLPLVLPEGPGLDFVPQRNGFLLPNATDASAKMFAA